MERCVDAGEAGQAAREAGRYKQAEADFRVCSQSACPAVVRHDCARWLSDLEARMPTVVAAATRGSEPLAEVSVELDGAPLMSRLTGVPVAIDPGEHTVVFRAGPDVVTTKIFVVTGQKNQLVTATFPAPTAPKPADRTPAESASDARERPFPWGPAALGATSILAFGGFGFLGLTTRSDLSTLESSPCGVSSTCDPSRTDEIRTRFLVADALLVTGIVALGAATWLLLRAPPSSAASTRSAR